ncbi:hypothetical protein HDU93_006881, partial [Gonapodya sp. JEL0774]
EVVSNPAIDLQVWEDGHAFGASHNTYTAHSGTSWSGISLNRMKYDQNGRVYDQAFFMENLPGIDKLTGELFDLPEVQNEVWKQFGIRL